MLRRGFAREIMKSLFASGMKYHLQSLPYHLAVLLLAQNGTLLPKVVILDVGMEIKITL